MKKEILKRIFVIIISGIIICSFSNISNATNETEDSNTTQIEVETNTDNTITQTEDMPSTQPETNKKEQKTTSTTTQGKSSNANLSDLGITPNDFKGFKYGTTTYNVAVPENIETIEVYAKTQDSKSKVSGTGRKTLEKGDNSFQVKVTAEDGTTKTYTINVKRSGENNNTTEDNKKQEDVKTNVEERNNDAKGLVEVRIQNIKKITPEFKTNIYEYTVEYIGEATELKIETKATNSEYIVDIVGNEKLKEGNENYITILVSDKEGNNIATYQLNVKKSLVDEEAIAKEKEEKKQKTLIISGIVAIIIIAIVIFIIIKKNRKNEYIDYNGYNNYKENNKSFFEEDDERENYEGKFVGNLEKLKTQEENDNYRIETEKNNNRKAYLDDFNVNNEKDFRKEKSKGRRFK